MEAAARTSRPEVHFLRRKKMSSSPVIETNHEHG